MAKIPHKQKGDPLLATEINLLALQARQGSSIRPGQNITQRNMGTYSAFGTDPEWFQSVFEITSLTIDDYDAADSGLYLGKILFWNDEDEEWGVKEGDEATEWEIDASVFGVSLFVGDKVTCFFNDQRGRFIPIVGGGGGGGSIELFQLQGPWDFDSVGQFGNAKRLVWDETTSSYIEESSGVIYHLHSIDVERWDRIYNGAVASSATVNRDIVLAKFDPVAGFWVVIESNQNYSRLAKAQSDWEISGSRAIVKVKIINSDSGLVISSTVITAQIHRNWASDLTSPAPAIWKDDLIWINVDLGGSIFVQGAIAFSYLTQIIDYTGSSTNIPKGFVLCDDSTLPADKKIGATKAPDMRGAFIMGIDPADTVGDASENAIGNVGGFRWHGESDEGLLNNNHPAHDNHEHRIKMTSIPKDTVDAGAGLTVWDASNPGGATPETTGVRFEAGFSANDDLLNHYGPFVHSGNRDTDNRPKYYVLAKLIRYK